LRVGNVQNLEYLRFLPTGLGYLFGRESTPGPPVFFTIETLNTCNLRCVYCPQSAGSEHFVNGRGTMSLASFERILTALSDAFGIKTVSLHRDGEPLLNRHLEDFVAAAANRGLAVTLSTNATRATPERARALLAAGLRMANTDFCADPSVYESLRVGGRWSDARDGVRNFLEAAGAAGGDFRFVIKDLDARDSEGRVLPDRLRATRELFDPATERLSVIPVHFHNALGESASDLSRKGPRQRYNLCHLPWVNMTIDWSGRVVACCRDLRSEYILGNILEQDPWSIWNGDAMRALRRALRRRRPQDINVCANCDLPWNGSYSGSSPLGRIGRFFGDRIWRRQS
jgi:radical SAM protein with 4Fe4S-binding SPASM domain